MGTSWTTKARAGAYAGLFLVVAAIEWWLVRPLEGGPAGADAATSVVYFDRIITGHRLETFVNTTPKPLLTLILGGLHAITGDWPAGAVVTVLATALAIVLAIELVRRVAGIEAAAFAGVGLVGLVSFQVETSWSYGLPWAFLLWMAAGLLLHRPRPRYGLAGLMLAVAGLARPETFILVGVALLALIVWTVRGPRPPRSAWLLMIGWLAILGLCAHDLLLTGDPLWWSRIARHSVELSGGRARSLSGTVHLSASLLIGYWPLAVAACVGGLRLLWVRAWVAAGGVIAMGPLIILYTWFLAFARINVLAHYLHPVDLAVVLAAAIGVGAILVEVRRRVSARWPRTSGTPAVLAACCVAIVLAVVGSRPFAPLSPSARSSIGAEARAAVRLRMVDGLLDGALTADRSNPEAVPGPMGTADPARAILYVPMHRIARPSVDLGLPWTRIAGLDPAKVNLARGYPALGSVVYLDGIVEPASTGAATRSLQVSGPTVVDGVLVVPILADPAKKMWIVRIEPAP